MHPCKVMLQAPSIQRSRFSGGPTIPLRIIVEFSERADGRLIRESLSRRSKWGQGMQFCAFCQAYLVGDLEGAKFSCERCPFEMFDGNGRLGCCNVFRLENYENYWTHVECFLRRVVRYKRERAIKMKVRDGHDPEACGTAECHNDCWGGRKALHVAMSSGVNGRTPEPVLH